MNATETATAVECDLLDAELVRVLHDEREWGCNPMADLLMRAGDRTFFAHFKHLSDPQPGAALLLRSLGETQLEVLQNECTAWQLACCLGPPYTELVAPTVWRDDLAVSDTGQGALSLHRLGEGSLAVTDPVQADAAALFDAVTWQADRHFDNYLWDQQSGRLTLIDHSFSFSDSDAAQPANGGGCFLMERWWHGRERLTDSERLVLARLPHTARALRPVLGAPRYDAMQGRAQAMLQHNRVLLPRTHDLAPGDECLPRLELKRRLWPSLTPASTDQPLRSTSPQATSASLYAARPSISLRAAADGGVDW